MDRPMRGLGWSLGCVEPCENGCRDEGVLRIREERMRGWPRGGVRKVEERVVGNDEHHLLPSPSLN